jgi:major vault protein
MAEENRERDLVLAPNEYAFISDQTKGNINVYVGPYKTSLANTDKPVIFAGDTKRFERVSLDESIETFITAPEGWYVVMKNPPKDGHQPKTGTTNNLAELNVGRKVNIPGPINFALWPGQMAKVLRGHNLRSNQYLLVRVYDEDEATKNWTKAVIKTKDGEGTPEELIETKPDLTMGKMLIIKGSNVSFYIPPTGVEVVQDEEGDYVREAVTLERLEYCILLDENGNKRFIQGPAVVFPEPTEEFIYRDGVRKFKAIELNEMSGLYIKVIAPYNEGKMSYKEGDELFITGKDQMIYYPRPEHAIIKYGKKERHYALAIPAGEGRYYLNRKTGKISLQKGPAMFLPDPREAVLVRRILHPKQVALWFPGNQEALQYNQQLQKLAKSETQDFVSDDVIQMEQEMLQPIPAAKALPEKRKEKVSKEIAGDEFERGEQFTPPRMLVLDTKYDGAVTINIWTGYAILVVSKTGTRKVIVGPQSYLLEYDENLEAFELSTGTPKTEENTIKSVYLRVLHNKVSDIVRAETSDYTQVNIQLSYRLNFEGEPEKWFNVENYVKFLTDHMRSFIRNAVKKYTIMDFYTNGIEIIREVILGKTAKDEKRPGRTFDENGMRIYDVEVLDIRLSDISLENLLIATQQDVVKQTLRVTSEQRKLEFTKETEKINQEIALAKSSTAKQNIDLENEETKKALELALVKIEAEIQTKEKRLLAELTEQDTLNQINQAELDRLKERENLQIELAQQKLAQELEKMKGEVEAVVAKAQAVSPNLVAALQAFADKALAEKMAQSMSPLAILGGKSVAEVLANLLKGTVLSNVLEQKVNGVVKNEITE